MFDTVDKVVEAAHFLCQYASARYHSVSTDICEQMVCCSKEGRFLRTIGRQLQKFEEKNRELGFVLKTNFVASPPRRASFSSWRRTSICAQILWFFRLESKNNRPHK